MRPSRAGPFCRHPVGSAKSAVAARAEELLQYDMHDQLLRIVGHMQAEATCGSSSSATRSLAAMQQAHTLAMADLDRRVAAGRARVQVLRSLGLGGCRYGNCLPMEMEPGRCVPLHIPGRIPRPTHARHRV